MKNRYEHRCQDSECGYFNQPTFSTCRCHKTREEMRDAERDVLLAALYSAERAVEDFCTGQAPNNQCWAVLAEINAAIAKATGESR